jgi:peptidyl-prolyl cis-trans isomerase C
MRKLILIMTAAVLAPAALTAAPAHAADAPVAKVNGRTLTTKDIHAALGGLSDGQRLSVLKDASSRKQILTSLIEQELLLQEAEKARLDQDREYKEALAAFRKQYLSSRILQKNLGPQLTDAAAKKYYERNKRIFSTDQVYVQHILMPTEQAANEMLKKAKEPNADFMELAEKNSKDPSAKNNRGDLGPITHDSPFVEEFKEAAFTAKEGAIVGPIKTSFGYHIIKVVKKMIGRPLQYDEVELKVKNRLREQLIENYVGRLRTQARISIDDKALDKM